MQGVNWESSWQNWVSSQCSRARILSAKAEKLPCASQQTNRRLTIVSVLPNVLISDFLKTEQKLFFEICLVIERVLFHGNSILERILKMKICEIYDFENFWIVCLAAIAIACFSSNKHKSRSFWQKLPNSCYRRLENFCRWDLCSSEICSWTWNWKVYTLQGRYR